MEYAIRLARPADLPALITFMKQAYGERTVFQSEDFLRWYLGRGPEADPAFHLESQIAVTPDGQVIGHYGGLSYELMLNGKAVSMVWGVNAYTLPECRRFGVGKQLVEATMARFDVFGVIGFTRKVAEFYHEIGFNIFDFQRFARYVRPLTDDTYALCRLIGKDETALRSHLAAAVAPAPVETGAVRELTAATLDTLTWDLPQPTDQATTDRTPEYLRWRFFSQPALRYTVLGLMAGDRVTGYAVVRQETLLPTDFQVSRVVDLYGQPADIAPLLQAVANLAQVRGSAYIDFNCFGLLHRTALLAAGFAELTETDIELLPQVSAPAEARPNYEHIGLFSTRYAAEIAALSPQNVYFTRADSDRDRLARIDQMVSQ